MKKSCRKYSSEDINRFVDNELSQDRCHELTRHLSHCADCSLLIEQYKSISIVFSDHADEQKLKIDPGKLKHKLNHGLESFQKKSVKNSFGFFGKNIYLKLASITAILVIGLFMSQRGGLFDPAGPSAIVKSVDTEFASVMIIETQKDKHTIIWFSET